MIQGGEFTASPNGPKKNEFNMCNWTSGPNGQYRLTVVFDRTGRDNGWGGEKDSAKPMSGFPASYGKHGSHKEVSIATEPDAGTVQVWGMMAGCWSEQRQCGPPRRSP
ncbi:MULTISPECIES: hypothetical protein [unclassified Streptomyces]|uniref:hypothetical protein n=1 Tax=unclassified Streptomyces TaxID=2593676 RepID=UPI002DDB5AD8|nr:MULTISPECIES: hypothetical protein [unclassified Streptomyces]WSA90138.1 hypothetical protein OIE63_00285 [Streptomyces sp. NBC_01795]WSB74369.1 hypothetical protein OHB04_00280 [Streptomyces sp. NBC_01775]WSS45992.1 hypothetical protein OG220_39365 [Streptomyces sp. NBC_01187]